MRKTTLTTPILLLAVFSLAVTVRADPVFFTYYNSESLMDEDLNLLEDGCIVQLIYSPDATIGPPSVYNGRPTGNDVLWETIHIGDGGVDPNTGSFLSTFVYDDSWQPGYVYVRFFNAPSWPFVTYYGQSPLHTLSDFWGFEVWDATEGALFLYTTYPFMIIPEPETWLTLLPALAFAVLIYRKKKKKETAINH